MEIGLQITTDRRVGLKFDEFPTQAHDELLGAITSATNKLRDMVVGATPKRSGKLASEITSSVVDGARSITGYVGVKGAVSNDYAKAAALEYGAHGTAHLREHGAKLSHLWSKMIEPMMVIVKAHNRKLNIAEHDFLRGPLRAIEAGTLSDLQAALARAVDQ